MHGEIDYDHMSLADSDSNDEGSNNLLEMTILSWHKAHFGEVTFSHDAMVDLRFILQSYEEGR